MGTINKIKTLLLHQQKKVEEEIKLLDEDDPVNSQAPIESSEPGTDSWVADTHTRTVAIKNTLRETLSKIKHALQSLSSGKYGKCEKCGKKIEQVRLQAVPTAILCISCSKK